MTIRGEMLPWYSSKMAIKWEKSPVPVFLVELVDIDAAKPHGWNGQFSQIHIKISPPNINKTNCYNE